MTIVVGIYCNNGVVIAADSALTLNGVVEQIYSEKLTCFNNNLVIGFAGELGFAQRYKNIIKKFWNSADATQLESFSTEEIIKQFCQLGIFEFMSTQFISKDAPLPLMHAPTDIIIGFVHKQQHNLVFLPLGQFQPIVINEELSFCSLGSGHFITNPFLNFVKDTFWSDKVIPDTSMGIFSAIMALNLAIKVNSGGINGPINIAVIEKDKDKNYNCRKLHPDELSDHEENVNEAIKYFSSYIHSFSKANVDKAPDIPRLSN